MRQKELRFPSWWKIWESKGRRDSVTVSVAILSCRAVLEGARAAVNRDYIWFGSLKLGRASAGSSREKSRVRKKSRAGFASCRTHTERCSKDEEQGEERRTGDKMGICEGSLFPLLFLLFTFFLTIKALSLSLSLCLKASPFSTFFSYSLSFAHTLLVLSYIFRFEFSSDGELLNIPSLHLLLSFTTQVFAS